MSSTFPLIAVLWICLLSSLPAGDLSLALADVGPRVRSANPSLLAARLAVAEVRGRHLASGRLANPSAGIDFQGESQVSPQVFGLTFEQTFPVTRRLRLEKKLTAQLVEAAELEVKDIERKLIAEAQSVAIHILALQEKLVLGTHRTALVSKVAAFVSEQSKTGEISPLEATQARVEAHQHRMEVRKWEGEITTHLASLKPMLGLTPAAQLILKGKLPPVRLPNSEPNRQNRPDFQLAQARANAAQIDATLAMANKWQDLTAAIFAAREQQEISPGNREHTGFAGVRLSIPLPLWNQNEGEILEKSATAQRAKLESDALEQTIAGEAEVAQSEMLALADMAEDTRRNLLPLVIAQSAELEKAYESGQTGQLSVLRAQQQRLELELDAIDLARDFHLARIRYEAATAISASP